MAYDEQDRLTALAGIYQAIACVMRVARSGSADTAAMEPCIYSLFQVDAADVTAVYGPSGVLTSGARQVIAQFTGRPERDLELTRYLASVIRLERKLANQPELLARVGQGIAAADAALQAHGEVLHPEILRRFAEIYSETLGQLNPRILVRGASAHLKDPDNQILIRALLLSAIRSARLWRQLGGTRWRLLFGHKHLLVQARRYLEQAEHHGA
jgi:high frequency lysogenization protein